MNNIQYIQHQHIDQAKWNRCIDESANGLIYAYAWYLDAMTNSQWDALVLHDYEAVMPVTWNKKYGISYIYQPYFCASLGVFAKTNITKQLVEQFLNSIPAKFKYFDFYLNHHNLFSIDQFPFTERMNYILDLSGNYHTIASVYRNNLSRNIKKAESNGLVVKENIALAEIMALAKETMQRISPITEEEFNRFEKVFSVAKQLNRAETFGIYSPAGELLSSAVFLYSHKRWYYILVGNSPFGKTNGASHYLIDRFIFKHAQTETILDFEGSDIRNLAFFYSSYGAAEEKYPALRMNKLPAILKWMKN
jgi:hypothetical protein